MFFMDGSFRSGFSSLAAARSSGLLSNPPGHVDDGMVFEVRPDHLESDRQPVGRATSRQHHRGQPAHAGERCPRDLVAVRAGYPIDDDAARVDVGLMVVRDRGGRRDRTQQYVVINEDSAQRATSSAQASSATA